MKKTFLSFSLFVVFVLAGLAFVSADVGAGTCGMMGGMMYGSYGSGMMIFGWLTYLLVIALIIAAIYWLIKSANRR